MPILPRRTFPSDEEHGKKSDDPRKPGARAVAPSLFKPARWRPIRRRRILFILLGVACVYFFVRNMPIAMGPPPNRFSPIVQAQPKFSLGTAPVSGGPPPGNNIPMQPGSAAKGKPAAGGGAGNGVGAGDREPKQPVQNYNGPIKFYSLAKSLYSFQGLRGSHRDKRNVVLFAAADLKALADLLPLACSMANGGKELKVHFAVMGREQVSLAGIQEVNNWSGKDCPVVWHDARPDYGPWSSEKRMGMSARAAFIHLEHYIKPSVIITRDEKADEPFLVDGISQEAGETDVAHIPLKGSSLDYTWLSKLNINSLKAFNDPSVELLVQAPPASSGSLIRLLEKLKRANYFTRAPGLTIELPPDTDSFLSRYLAKLKWPPGSDSQSFTLRRRISPHHLPPEEAAIRAVDAFYPKNVSTSHVMVLSPQTDLSPSFYHYLMYSILHYKYSGNNKAALKRLLGISLDLPSAWPTSEESFTPPEQALPKKLRKEEDLEKQEDEQDRTARDAVPVFLWQLPSSSAALYFGDKWAELHSFMYNRHVIASRPDSQVKAWEPTMSKKLPSWLDYALELVRARGYYMAYPAFKKEDDLAMAVVHNELWKLPEEFEGDEKGGEKKEQPKEKEQKKERRAAIKPEKEDKEQDEETDAKAEDKNKENDKESQQKKESSDPKAIDNPEEALTGDVASNGKKPQQPKPDDNDITSKLSLGSVEHPTLDSAVINDLFTSYPAGLPELTQLSILPHSSKITKGSGDINVRTKEYVAEFRRKFGGCTEEELKKKEKGTGEERPDEFSTDDLFCLRDGEAEYA